MREQMFSQGVTDDMTSAEGFPVHDAKILTNGETQARIVLDGQVYTLRITKANKLILTK